jgi:hypothetical protein
MKELAHRAFRLATVSLLVPAAILASAAASQLKNGECLEVKAGLHSLPESKTRARRSNFDRSHIRGA